MEGSESLPERPSWDEYYLGIAQAVSARGDCSQRGVGAVVVHRAGNWIAGAGFGAPPGCLEEPCPRVYAAQLCAGYSDGRAARGYSRHRMDESVKIDKFLLFVWSTAAVVCLLFWGAVALLILKFFGIL
ncbi:hypothetical protein E1298_01890 [Actinomadura rubrisoli]|uniref:Uncharacterized protein n=1 Tax=Actinomadura rubrisoli TaxID=2530368 RepID=A0A4V2YZI6_9ACTN|nr:hypothetical protein E1298_01890 [Actinomadura rubrisoli]